MTITTQPTSEATLSTTTKNYKQFTDWSEFSDESPSESDERGARERTLEIGNATEVGYDTGSYAKRYKRLDQHNRDNYWKHRDDVDVPKSADYQFKRSMVLSFAQEVSLSPLQRQLAIDEFLSIDLPRFGYRGQVVAFCVCASILNHEAADYFGTEKPYHPARKAENNHDGFARLEARLIERWGTVTKHIIQSVYTKLTQCNPPTRDEDQTRKSSFDGAVVQRHPSYRPKWADI